MSYQLVYSSPSVIRLADGVHIPEAPGNRDWEEYQAWLAAGNTPLPAAQPVTPEEIIVIEAAHAAPNEARAWFAANPAAEQLFLLTVAEVEAEIVATIEALFPAGPANQKNRLKLLLMAISVNIRVLVKREQQRK